MFIASRDAAVLAYTPPPDSLPLLQLWLSMPLNLREVQPPACPLGVWRPCCTEPRDTVTGLSSSVENVDSMLHGGWAQLDCSPCVHFTGSCTAAT